jgi:hypothetical protein
MTALAKTSSNGKLYTPPLVRGDVCVRFMAARVQLRKKLLVVSLKGLVANTN